MSQRRGFTLVEVLLALVIMGVVAGAIYRLLNTNQRLALAQAEQVSLQSNVRTAAIVQDDGHPSGGAPRRDEVHAPVAVRIASRQVSR